ncbi:MAG TPA: DUF3014 domain-containing protein, partial [Roseateles sp.]|nr:DUF3014 domain-containing protein [Roseateles sp.]
ALRDTLGRKSVARQLYLEPLARRFVASVDGLGQPNPPTSMWLLKPAPATLALTKPRRGGDAPVIAAANARRYQPFLRWLERIDTAQALRLYQRLYPLLQQAYIEQGHPDGHFNDRLIEVIDQLLATPAPAGPLRLKPVSPRPSRSATTPPQPRYEFADPALEALSTGQKTLLRMGPQNASRLKARLRAWRAGLVQLEQPR